MQIRQCRRCDRLFSSIGQDTCPTCVKEMDDMLLKVREFLYSHKNASADDICDATGAEEKDILRWMREGRLIVSGSGVNYLNCERCKKPIPAGRYCDACTQEMISTLESTTTKMGGKPSPSKPASSDATGPRMRTVPWERK